MLNLSEFLSSNKNYIALAAAVALSLILMAWDRGKGANLARQVTTTVLGSGNRMFSWATRMADLSRENKFLRDWNLELSIKYWRLREAELENIRLRRQMGFKQRPGFRYLPAEVIAKSGSRMVTSILINVGSDDGVREQMPVVALGGLAGKVFGVNSKTSVVQLLSDRNCVVSTVVQNDERIFGFLESEGTELFRIDVPLKSNIKKGDVVVSSGMGGVFPKGLKLGVVNKLGDGKSGLFRKVEIVSSVNLSQLEEVFVLCQDDCEDWVEADRLYSGEVEAPQGHPNSEWSRNLTKDPLTASGIPLISFPFREQLRTR